MGRRALMDAVEAAQLPPGTPLFADVEKAAELLSVSAQTVYRMMRANGLPVVYAGRKPLLDVPRLYAWMSQRLGERIEV